MRFSLSLISLLLTQTLFGIAPWWTGSLLSSNAAPAKPGQIKCEPFVSSLDRYGAYNGSWKEHGKRSLYANSLLLFFATGLTDWTEVGYKAQVYHNIRGSKHFTGVGDCSVYLKMKLCDETPNKPAMSLVLRETLPTGNARHIDPEFFGADQVGAGSFITTLGWLVQKNVLLPNQHWLRWRINASIGYGHPVHVNGITVYGGGPNTHGVIDPGLILFLLGSLEYQITQHWVFACDFTGQHITTTSFSGNAGLLNDKPAGVGLPSNEVFTIAPAIEYNFNEHIGIIGGFWITCLGRHVGAFIDPIIAVNMVY